MKVIDLSAEREKRDGPDPQFVTTDDAGRKMFAFHAEYQMGEAIFAIQFFAYDFGDAERRVSAMRETLKLAGQIYCEL